MDLQLFQVNALLWIALYIFWLFLNRTTHQQKQREALLLKLSHFLPTVTSLIFLFQIIKIFPSNFHQSHTLVGFGELLVVIGFGFAIWARFQIGNIWSGSVSLQENHQLVRTGPYALVRHPIYAGLILSALGTGIVAGTYDAMIGFIIFAAAHLVKIHREEHLMEKAFGDVFHQYKKSVPLLIPDFPP